MIKRKHYDLRLRKQSNIWYFRVPGGKWESTKCHDRSAAEDFTKQYIKIVLNISDVLTLREYLVPFFTENCPHKAIAMYEKGRTYGEEYRESQRSILRRLILPDEICDSPLDKITTKDIRKFRDRLIVKYPDYPSIPDNVIKTLKIVFEQATVDEVINRNPAKGISRNRKRRRIIKILSISEIKTLFPGDSLGSWRDVETRICFLLALTTGMRRSELLALSWPSLTLLDPKNGEATGYGYVKVVAAIKGNKNISPIGKPKSERFREVYIPKFVAKEIQAYKELKESMGFDTLRGFVFCRNDGTRRRYHWWGDGFNKALDTAGISRIGRTPHGLRHTINTIVSSNAVDVASMLRGSLGWENASTQQIYDHSNQAGEIVMASFIDKLLSYEYDNPENILDFKK